MTFEHSKPRVAALFATMNRHATAVQCVQALAAQTSTPEMVVIADNLSTDSTVADLEAMEKLPFVLDVIRMKENAGNAGGVQVAMDRAFAEGAEAVWILDDDSWPRPDALQALLEAPWDGSSVRHALQIDPATGRFTWPLLIPDPYKGSRLAWCGDDLPAGDLIESLASWTGALVPRAIRERVGPVMGELFIRGEDEEYPARITRSGFRFYACRGAVMDHPGPRNLVEWRFLGKRLFYETDLPDWKLFYKIRNMVWLKRRESGDLRAILMAKAYAAAVLRFDGPSRLPLVGRAALDGWRGKLGRIS